MRRTHKPVHKCYDCPLNLGERCAVYAYPHDMWHGRKKCPGYRNERMFAEWQAEEQRRSEKGDVVARKAEMKERQTEAVHEDGKLDPKHPKRSGFTKLKSAMKKKAKASKKAERRRPR